MWCFTDSSSEDCITHEKSENNQSTIASDLRNWAAEYNCTLSSVTALLKILGKHNIEGLPLDSRTLLKTPHIVSQLECFGGNCIYMGPKENIITGLESLEKDDEDVEDVVLNPTLYEHFLSLTVAISMLSCIGLSLEMINYSRIYLYSM